MQQRNRRRGGSSGEVIGFCLFFGVLWYLGIAQKVANGISEFITPGSTRPARLGNTAEGAYAEGQEIISDNLVNPKSAVFPPIGTPGVIVEHPIEAGATGNHWIINSYVDSTNIFGTTVRSKWKGDFRFQPGEYSDESFNWNNGSVTPDRSNGAFTQPTQ